MQTVYSPTMKQKLLLPIIAFLVLPGALFATHNRAGEIHIEQIGPLTIRATIITWTKTSSVNADRDTLDINWGDGFIQKVPRNNGGGFPPQGVPLANDIKYNTYVAEHTYAGPSVYIIGMTDQNRIGGIINVNPPASDNVPFHIQTTFIFQDAQFGGTNITPYLLQPPIDNACVGKPFKHNPNAYDPDLDSLSYDLIVPLQGPNAEVPNYSFPNEIGIGIDNSFTLNAQTGEILWQSPKVPGVYNIAFVITSWRKGKVIDRTIRDMQIFVSSCNNNPPVVEAIDKICVVAGNEIDFTVRGSDIDTTDLIMLSAIGAPMISPYSPATFTAPIVWQKSPVTGQFHWKTACEHISNQPYTVVFKATDTLTAPQLADLYTVSIKVVGPAPEDVQADASQGKIEVSWELPYICEDAAEKYFLGFSVWRREGSNPFIPDTCDPGLAGKGYTQLTPLTKAVKDGRYFYKDTLVERGRTYCYRILAKFARTSAGGYPYNVVESLASEEVCAQLPRDLPLLTNVSIEATDQTNGRIYIAWSKPVAADLDTVINHGPYRYQLRRATGFSGGAFSDIPGASFTANEFWQANDTIFAFDEALNTVAGPYRYQVDFYVNNNLLLGHTRDASSVFLSVISTDQTNILQWEHNVPWNNYQYRIFRKNELTGQFEPLGTSNTKQYEDRGLVNGQEYCYYVESEGTYSISGLLNPLFNKSQEICGVPIDTVAPCAPVLMVSNLCDDPNQANPGPPYLNQLSWTNPNTSCDGTDDAVAYKIWYTALEGEPLSLLTDQEGVTNVTFTHSLPDQLAGCYAVSAIDSVGNESLRSNLVCVDNCPNYELPNAFTPNGDGANDLYTPFPGWRFIAYIDLQIFNRWGNLVFQTSQPEINWTGVNEQGKELAEGTYFYICKVFERRVEGVVLRPDLLQGYIELIRGE
ncbi:MAG: gliding motility-associated C-terminal domain-containing protein [Saprospiraceae bacterium]|nr:gliding motility-associated C-terminal domain-containing protein [Saprospiraceae bacterium]